MAHQHTGRKRAFVPKYMKGKQIKKRKLDNESRAKKLHETSEKKFKSKGPQKKSGAKKSSKFKGKKHGK